MRNGSSSKSQKSQGTEGIELTPLTTDEVRRLPKPHTGFEQFAGSLAALVEDYPTELGTGGINLAAMRASLARYQALAAPRAAAAQQLALVDDTRLAQGSAAWAQMLLIYSRAQVAARTNINVRRAIEAFERFMKHPAHKKATVTTPATPSTPTTT